MYIGLNERGWKLCCLYSKNLCIYIKWIYCMEQKNILWSTKWLHLYDTWIFRHFFYFTEIFFIDRFYPPPFVVRLKNIVLWIVVLNFMDFDKIENMKVEYIKTVWQWLEFFWVIENVIESITYRSWFNINQWLHVRAVVILAQNS